METKDIPALSEQETEKAEKRKYRIAMLCAYLGHIIWGFSLLFTRMAIRVADPDVLLAWRFLVATLIMTVLVLTKRVHVSFRGKQWGPAILLVVLQLIYYITESYSVYYTNTTFSGVVLAVSPVLSILFALLFLKEYPSRRQVLFCFLPVIGVIVMTLSGSSLGIIQPIGLACLIVTCVVSGAYKTVNRKTAESFSSFERSYFVLAASAVGYVIMALASNGFDIKAFVSPLADPQFLIPMLVLSVFCSIGANLLVNYSVKSMTVIKYSSFGSLSTLCSMFAGVIFLDEPLTVAIFIGAVLILVGIHEVTKQK